MQPQTRNKTKTRPAQHEALCGVCKHERRQEIERLYLAFERGAKLATNFGLSKSAITRHVQYFGLDARRAADTEPILRHIAAKGFQQIKRVDGQLFMAAIKELNKLLGKYKQPQAAPADVRRAQDNRAWAEAQIERLMLDRNLTRAEALELARQRAPTLVKFLM